MPASSTRTTAIESTLLHHFSRTYHRLHFANMHPQAGFLTRQFAVLLDLSESELLAKLNGAYWRRTEQKRKDLQELEEERGKERGSERILRAGNELADAAVALKRVGRMGEGGRCAQWGEELWQIACEAYDDEERYAWWQGRTRDVDMS